MSGRRSYLAAAFNARPFGMPVPPNWFAVAAFGLLGALVDPGFWLIGAGFEGLYLFALSRSARFRKVVDAGAERPSWDSRYEALHGHLDVEARELQAGVEKRAREIVALLSRTGASESQIGDVRQMAWLHLRLLAARASFLQVIAAAGRGDAGRVRADPNTVTLGLSRYRLKTLKAYRSSFSVLLVILRSPRSAPSSYILRTVVRSSV